jgi:hypothetical protein
MNAMHIRVYRILALALFALLQAAAPLMHVHIGPPRGVHFHIPVPEALGASQAQRYQTVSLAGSSAIEVSDANKKRDFEALDLPAPSTISRTRHALLVAVRDEPQVLGPHLAYSRLSRFTLPPSQAPPNNAG